VFAFLGIEIALLLRRMMTFRTDGTYLVTPVNAKEALENFLDFVEYTTEPSIEFLQFTEILVTK
jgi:hypothetical protein